ncbi:transcription factor TFIIIB component B'' homolog [Zalophus californianus]|uniref:Transcription factor TFIIIB component B'' homolog n=1 Tax=Zalophus californianus TaxID=9704 RepID=A0A6J2E3N5_ZALCA|nr:transcription factor TFIIIB component B'' homolog [Zalophus californianus]XP_027461597.2 transcription factor TFIIIB component B'' homolog [Zalophus californianus]XP_027461598.2 transcription factor TFIIIB component B'' homolog [Zalophus californianus]
MFRRARLSVKPNVRPGVGARGSTAPNPQRGQEAPRPQDPAAASSPKPAESTDVPLVDCGGSEPQEKAPRSSDEKTDSENYVEESSKSSSTVSQRRKRISSTPTLVKPGVNVPSESHPLSTVNQEVPQPNPVSTKEEQPCSDRYRLYKAQKLREMLKEELRKEKKQWKNKYAINESQKPPDRSKMTMRDFIYYLPDNNPMTSSLEQEKKTEKSLTPVQTREQEGKSTPDPADNEELEEEVDDGPLLVPRVKVAEDGSIILDEESLTVEVLRTKGPCVVEENDPIFERGSTTTYSSFRKNYYSKPWSNKETDMFFLAISMVGTDFSMIGQLFPHRARIEIKNKFKREEKTNGWRIDKAFQEKRPFDFDFFAHLLQKVLAEEEKRKQKSVKNQSLKEKKSSKPRKNVKVKKVASEGGNDDPDVSPSTKISDTESPQKDAQIVEEEQQSQTLTGQDSEQIALEPNLNQKKRRRKNQDEVGKQEVKNLSGNATVQLGHSKGEKYKNKDQSLRTEINEDEVSKEQKLSCLQNMDDIVDLSSSEKAEKRADPILLSSDQQGAATSLATEASESSPSDLPLSEAGITSLCEVNNVESSCTEEGSVDLKNKSLETDQSRNVKLMGRRQLQRPKPNLSRAVGKKPVLSQGKTDAESKSLHAETSVEKNHMEKDKVNTLDVSGMGNTERENPEAETVSTSSEKTGLQEDDQAKAVRPARLMRGRLQRPKPNVGKAAERKEILASQEKIEANVKKNESQSCITRDSPEQVEDQSCKNFDFEDITLQSEKEDNFFQMNVNECVSIQEDNKVPVLKTRFQKPKPNIGRGARRREIFSKEAVSEEIVTSGQFTAPLGEITRVEETLPRESILVEANTTKEMESYLKKTERDNSPREKIPEMRDNTVDMETDLKETGREVSPKDTISEVSDVIEESVTDLEETGREVSPRDTISEVSDVTEERVTDLEETGREVSPRDTISEVSDVTEERVTDLEETGRREISLQENALEVSTTDEVETGLEETGSEVSVRENVPEMVDATEDRETHLEKTERREIGTEGKAPQVETQGEMETDWKEIEKGTSLREKVLVGISAMGEREIDLKETGKRDLSLMEEVSGKTTATEETEAESKETGGDISLKKSRSEEINAPEEMAADVEKTGKIDISLRKNGAETRTSRQTDTDLMQSSSSCCSTMPSLNTKNVSSEVLSMVHTPEEEKRNSEKELSGHLSCLKTSLQTSEPDKTEDRGMLSSDVPEQFSDTNLSKSLPQEQKPLEVKPAPFVRSRFKRPKPNLARATLKRETTEAEKYVSGKKLETDNTETVVVQQGSDQMNSLPSQHGVASLMTSREKDISGHREEESVILPCIQTEKDLSPLSSCDPKELSQPTQAQEKELVVSTGAHNTSTFQQEVKESVIPTAQTVRSRFQRPRPNIRKTGQRQIEKGEAEGIIKEERTIVQKDEIKKFLTVPNSPIGTEIEVVSSKVSESQYENQSHMVLVEPLHLNKINVLDEKMRHEPKRSVPSVAHLVRRQFQKAKPNLGRAHGKKEEPGIEKHRADQSEARKPEDNLLQPGDSDTHLLQKEKAEFLTSLEVSARKDCVDSTEASLAKNNAPSEVGPSGSGEKTVGDKSVSSVAEEQCLSKLSSSPQLLKESNYSKIGLDRRATVSSASECEVDHSGRRMHRKMKPSVTRGRGSKRVRSKTFKKEPRASKATLVTLRASQEEDEDDDEDFEPDYEDESYHLAPEEVNKAPVFVPIGLRSPEPVSAQIEETMEELEITVNVPDIGIAVVEHPLSNTDVTTQEMKQEENLKALSVEINTGEHTQDETGTNDGSTEAAITLLTMGDLVLQSEIGTEQSDGVCVLLDVHSKDKSCVPFSPDNVNHKIVRECQELSSPVNSTSPSSLEENKIVLEEQSTKEEIGLVEKVKENAVSTRNTTSEVTGNLRMRSRFAKPKPNLETSGTNRFGVHQEVPSVFVNKGEVVESQRETEKNASEATELQDENLGSLTTAENKEQSKLACEHGIEETISQEANLTERNDDQEEESQKVQISSVAPVVSFETRPHTLGSDMVLSESSIKEPQRKDSNGDSVLALHVSEGTPTSMLEVQQENVISSQDLAVNLVANVHQDGEDEQAFILTLVEIPTNAVEEFSDTTAQLMPNPLLPAPILIKSVNTEERSDMSFPVTSVGQDTMCLSDSGKDGSEEPPPANLDLISRKRFHCMLDESNHVPPAKKSLLTSGDDCQNHTSEVCSKEMINVSEETGESYKEQGIFPTSGSTHTTPEPQKEQLEPTFQSIGSGSPDKVTDTHIEKSTSQLPQDERSVSDKEERTCAASKSEQMDSIPSSSKTPLSRPGRRPLGFLSLICSKNSLESDEPTQVYNKKRLKPLIPIPRKNLKRSNPLTESQKKIQESSDQLPSPRVVDTPSESIGSSATQVSCDPPLPKEESKSGQNRVPEEEPTTVSEYFFSDIFIEVDETE